MNNAVQLWDGQLSVITTPIPHVKSPNEVIVKVVFSGICNTDISILSGDFPSAKSVILGHEFSGVVSEVGSDVKHISIGARVAVNPNSSCQMCLYCQRGNPHFCNNSGVHSTLGIWRNGGWSQYCRVPMSCVHILPPQVSLRQASLCEPISCVAHGFDLLSPLPTDADVLICGAGFWGLIWSCLLHYYGYRKVKVSEISERRRNLVISLDLGYKVFHPKVLESQARECTVEKNTEWGFDAVIDTSGNGKEIEEAIHWLRHGGKLLISGCNPKDSDIKVNPHEIYSKELRLIGSLMNPHTFPKAIQLVKDMARRYLDYERLGIAVFQLGNYPAALTALSKHEITKAMFET